MPIGGLKTAAILKLINDANVFDMVQGRVFDKSLHEHEADDIEFPMIVISIIGGPSLHDEGTFVRPAIQAQIYSKKDYAEAWAIAARCDRALIKQRLVHDDDDLGQTVGVPSRQQIGQENFDPDLKASYVTIQYKTPMVESANV